jgi:hypothetical protein
LTAYVLAFCFAVTGFANAGSNAGSGTGGVKKVGCATAKSGGNLKWLPYQPQSDNVQENTEQSVRAVQWTTTDQANTAHQLPSGEFDDPFGDKQSSAGSESAGKTGESLILPSAGSGGSAALPKFRTVTKSAGDKSLAAPEKETDAQLKTDASNGQVTKGLNIIGGQTLEQALSTKNPGLKDGCLSVKDLKKISELSTDVTPSPGDLPKDCPWGGDDFRSRSWAPVTFAWTASALCHHPLYFEDVKLERYGHAVGPWLQPFASAARFYLTLPILPYMMGLELPDECMYTLGYYRPGDCAPYMLDPLPLSIRATLFEGGAWIAGAAIIP